MGQYALSIVGEVSRCPVLIGTLLQVNHSLYVIKEVWEKEENEITRYANEKRGLCHVLLMRFQVFNSISANHFIAKAILKE
jgi:hypothetical protein